MEVLKKHNKLNNKMISIRSGKTRINARTTIRYSGTGSYIPPDYPIIQVQKKGFGSSYSSQSMDLEFDNTPTENNLLVAVLSTGGGITTPPTGWSLGYAIDGFCSNHIYYKIAGVSEPTNVSAIQTWDDTFAMAIFEYSGIATSGTLDSTSWNVQTVSGSITSDILTTSANNCLILAGIGLTTYVDTGGPHEVASFSDSFVEEIEAIDVGSHSCVVGSRIVSVSGSYDTTATYNQNSLLTNADNIILIAFRKAT